MNALLTRLGVENPVILAPMAGGPGSPELAAAVSNAGGLGCLGAAYLPPEQLRSDIRRIRTLTAKPFGVNLFARGPEAPQLVDPGPIVAILAEIHQKFGLAPPAPPAPVPDPFPEQLAVILEEHVPVFSFTFGMPDRAALEALRKRRILILGSATTMEEAHLLSKAGVDAIVAQGAEAGAHRGTFAGSFETSMIPIRDLVRDISRTLPEPVVASGGIMDGCDMAQMMALGASAVQMGTAFLACPESGASEAYKRAILAARQDTTVVTRSFSGRPARGIRNAFIEKLSGRENLALPFPLQNSLTRAMRAESARRGDPDFLSLWAGQGVARARSLPAAELVGLLLEEMRNAPEHPPKAGI